MEHKDRFTTRKETAMKNPTARKPAAAEGARKPTAPMGTSKNADPVRHDTNDQAVPPTPANVGRPVASRQRLSDLLSNSDRRNLASAWDTAGAAEDFAPLPLGEYEAHVIEGALRRANTGTPGYKLTFEVAEGTYTGRKFWHDVWLTPAAVPMAKRDLAKLGVPVEDFNDMRAHLERPLPEGIRCRVRLTLRTNDDGGQSNRVQRFDVIGIDGPNVDAFAPENAEIDDQLETEEEGEEPEEPEEEEDEAPAQPEEEEEDELL